MKERDEEELKDNVSITSQVPSVYSISTLYITTDKSKKCSNDRIA